MSAIHLSPLVMSNLMTIGTSKRKSRQPAIEVTMYRCPVCDDLHEDEEDAEDCCQDCRQESADGGIICPVCKADHCDHHEAADCCLWHDIDAPTRWRIAARVEAGAEWLEAIAQEGGAA